MLLFNCSKARSVEVANVKSLEKKQHMEHHKQSRVASIREWSISIYPVQQVKRQIESYQYPVIVVCANFDGEVSIYFLDKDHRPSEVID